MTCSTRAESWTKAIGIDFHEVRLAANGHELTLVFSELRVSELAPDYTPGAQARSDRRALPQAFEQFQYRTVPLEGARRGAPPSSACAR